MNAYKTLKVGLSASKEEIQAAFDKESKAAGDDLERALSVNLAYSMLIDPSLREEHDRDIRSGKIHRQEAEEAEELERIKRGSARPVMVEEIEAPTEVASQAIPENINIHVPQAYNHRHEHTHQHYHHGNVYTNPYAASWNPVIGWFLFAIAIAFTGLMMVA